MKIEGQKNKFYGDSYNQHVELEAKNAPIELKLLFGVVMLAEFGGIAYTVFCGGKDLISMLTGIFLTMGIGFTGISGLCYWIAFIKNEVKPFTKVILSIFTVIGVLFLVLPILIRIFDPWRLLIYGVPLLFFAISFGLLIGGYIQKKHTLGCCTKNKGYRIFFVMGIVFLLETLLILVPIVVILSALTDCGV